MRIKRFLQKLSLSIALLSLPCLALAKKLPAFAYDITGLTKPELNNAQERMKILISNVKHFDKRKARLTYRAGFNEIKTAVQPFGYYRPQVTGSFTRTKGQWLAKYNVTLNTPIRVKSLTISIVGPGKHNRVFVKTIKKLPLKKGDILDVATYQKTKVELMHTAKNNGYTYARFAEDETRVNLFHYRADMVLVLDTGPQYYFGPISFNKTPLNNAFLHRFVNYKVGQPFNPNTLNALQSIYAGTGYFRSASLTPNIPNEKSKQRSVPIDANFEMNKKHLYQFGIGYGTASGPRLLSTINWRWINQYGHKFKLNALWSRTYYDLNAQYLIPAHKPATQYYTINGAMYILTPQHATAYVARFGPGYLWQYGKWTYEAYLYYLMEKWRLSDSDSYKNSRLLLPELDALWLSTQDTTLVENGAKVKFQLKGAYKGALSSVSYIQPAASFKGILTLGQNNRFILGVQTGFTIGGEFNQIPISERFWAGGDNSILGFDFQGIGPGRYLTVANLAYQRRIYEQIYGQVFYDIGNAFNYFTDYTHNLARTAGLAAVWRTPVGDLTIYWAKILSKPKQPNQFGFSLGPEL